MNILHHIFVIVLYVLIWISLLWNREVNFLHWKKLQYKMNVIKYLALANHKVIRVPSRYCWHWVSSICNQVDVERIVAVGPDRACAEWLLRCGAGVKWKGIDEYLRDYNAFPPEKIKLYIQEIDGTESCIMHHGFSYLKGLKHLDRIVLHNCMYLEDTAVNMLRYTKNTLEHLQLSNCEDITCEGVKSLHQLDNLKSLVLFNLPAVQNRERECLEFLTKKLPQCQIHFSKENVTEAKT